MQHACKDCGAPVSLVGAYARESGSEYYHLGCYRELHRADGERYGRASLLAQQEAARKEAEQRVQTARLDAVRYLPRCSRCGVRVFVAGGTYDQATIVKIAAAHAYVVCEESSGVRGVCRKCVDEEVAARGQARGALPQPAAARPAQPPVQEKPTRKDRFEVIEME